MIHIGASDFRWAFDAMIDMARQGAVAITKEGADYLVVLPAGEYTRLMGRQASDIPATGEPAGEVRAYEREADRAAY